MGGGVTRRELLAGAGSATIALYAGCSTRSQSACHYDHTAEDLLRDVRGREPADYDEEELQAWRALELYHQELEHLVEEYRDRVEKDCPVRPEGSVFLGEKHILGDGMQGVLAELTAAEDSGGYDVLGLEFFSVNDPIVEGFNNRTVPRSVERWREETGFDQYFADDITAEEMAVHYLNPLVKGIGGLSPIRWKRDKDTLVDIFRFCQEQDVTVVGLEPEMYHPLYPVQAWGEETRVLENDPAFSRERFKAIVDHAEDRVAAGERLLSLSGYAHTQEAMHTYTALLAGALPRIRDALTPEDLIEHPYSYKPIVTSTLDLPFYVLDEETYTLHGRMPNQTTMYVASTAELLLDYTGHRMFLDTDTDTELLDQQISILEALQELESAQPLSAASSFDFLVRLHPHMDWDNSERSRDPWDPRRTTQFHNPADNLVMNALQDDTALHFRAETPHA